jgi:hypothetical protein
MKSQEVSADIVALLRARNPLLWVVTREEARVEGHLIQAAKTAKYYPRTWDAAAGLAEIDGRSSNIQGSADPAAALSEINSRATGERAKPERGLWIMRDLAPWVTGAAGMVTLRQLRNVVRVLPGAPRSQAQAIVVLSTSTEIPSELANHAAIIEWPLPDRDEIAAILDTTVDAQPDDIKGSATSNGTRDAAIDAAVGLSGEDASACFARSLVQLHRIDPEERSEGASDGL